MMGGNEEWYDDTPWADPAIAAGYKAALGGFLVQFNAVENLLTDLLAHSFNKLGRPDLHRPQDHLDQKLRTFEIVGLALPQMHAPNFKELHDLKGERNTLAHGHFEQNPFSGEYEIVGHKGKVSDWSEGKIRALEDRTIIAWSDLRDCKAFFWFGDEPEDEK